MPATMPVSRGYATQRRRSQFTGFLPHARAERYFDRARVLVNTSLHEGVPNTFLQAGARGVPRVGVVDTGAGRRGALLCRIVYRVEAAASGSERLFTDEGHCSL